MEEASLELVRFLVRLILPVGVIAVCVGLVTLAVTIFPPKKIRVSGRILLGGPLPRNPAPILERIAVGLSAPISILGLVVVVQTVRLRNPNEPPYWSLSVIFVVATILTSLPSIFWKTRLRIAAEGVASIALAVASMLAGFSIGFLFVPLTLLMTWTCVRHLRDIAQSRNHILEARRP